MQQRPASRSVKQSRRALLPSRRRRIPFQSTRRLRATLSLMLLSSVSSAKRRRESSLNSRLPRSQHLPQMRRLKVRKTLLRTRTTRRMRMKSSRKHQPVRAQLPPRIQRALGPKVETEDRGQPGTRRRELAEARKMASSPQTWSGRPSPSRRQEVKELRRETRLRRLKMTRRLLRLSPLQSKKSRSRIQTMMTMSKLRTSLARWLMRPLIRLLARPQRMHPKKLMSRRRLSLSPPSSSHNHSLQLPRSQRTRQRQPRLRASRFHPRWWEVPFQAWCRIHMEPTHT